jgi:hypothetical protein
MDEFHGQIGNCRLGKAAIMLQPGDKNQPTFAVFCPLHTERKGKT